MLRKFKKCDKKIKEKIEKKIAILSDFFSGVCHGDDALYVVKFVGVNTTSTENDREMQKDLLDLWTTFADKGYYYISLRQ